MISHTDSKCFRETSFEKKTVAPPTGNPRNPNVESSNPQVAGWSWSGRLCRGIPREAFCPPSPPFPVKWWIVFLSVCWMEFHWVTSRGSPESSVILSLWVVMRISRAVNAVHCVNVWICARSAVVAFEGRTPDELVAVPGPARAGAIATRVARERPAASRQDRTRLAP